jgi:hypothetical protein
MPDIFGNDPTESNEAAPAPEPEKAEPEPKPEPTTDPPLPDITEGDVVEIPHKSTRTRKRSGFARRIEGRVAWVESDTKNVTGWYPLVCLKPLNG